MHKQIIALVPNAQETELCETFGYSSRGIPGLEIVGLGQKGKILKEKMIFLNKKYKFAIPARRYVICVEDSFSKLAKDEHYRWLELPLLLMYWSMAEVIPIKNLNNCMCGGRVSSKGKIETVSLSINSLDKINRHIKMGYKIITASDQGDDSEAVIPLDKIIVLN